MTSTPLLDDSFCDLPNTRVQFSEGRESDKIGTSQILKQRHFVVVMTEQKFKAFFIYIDVQSAVSDSKGMRCEIDDSGSVSSTITNLYLSRYIY